MLSSRSQKIEVGLVALDEVLVAESVEAVGLLALASIGWIIAGHEVVEVGAVQGVGLQGEALAGTQVVYPQVLGPRGFACGLAVEEENVDLHPLGIEDPRGQAQQGVGVAFLN